MLINLSEFYTKCIEIGTLSERSQELIDKIMSMSNPMKFDNDLATDEELDTLEHDLDRIYSREPNVNKFKGLLINLKPVKSSGLTFI